MPNGLDLPELSPGLNVIVGPNASGKSTVVRSMHATLWPDDGRAKGLFARTSWALGDNERVAELAYGRTSWGDADPPVLPSADVATRYRLGIGDLLDAGQQDRDIARDVAREMAGGVDIGAAKQSFGRSVRPPRKLESAVREARKAVREAESTARDFAGEEERRKRFARDRDDARRAAALLPAAEALVNIGEQEAELAGIDAQLEALPPGLDLLGGGELRRLDELAGDLDETKARETELAGRLEQAKVAARENAFPGDAPAPEVVEAWTSRADGFIRLEQRIADREHELAGLTADESEAQAALLPDGADVSTIPEESLQKLEAALDAVRTAEAACAGATSRREAWEAERPESDETIESLAAGAAALRQWLRTPSGISLARTLPPWLAWAALALGAVAVVISIPLSVTHLALVGGLLAGLGAGLLFSGRKRQDGDAARARRDAEKEAARVGATPEAWQPAGVRTALERVERKLDAVRLGERAAARAREAGKAEDAAAKNLEVARVEWNAALATVGLTEGLLGLSAIQQGRLLQRWLAARAERKRCEAEREEASRRLEEGLSAAGDWLGACGAPAVEDGAAAQAAVRAVAERRRLWESARKDQTTLSRELTSVGHDVTRLKQRLLDFWRDIDVPEGDRAELQRRVDELPNWKELTTNRTVLLGQLEQYRQTVQTHADALVEYGVAVDEPVDATRASALREELREAATSVEDLARTIGAIDEKLRGAREGTTVSDALSARDAALAELAETRDNALGDALARLVLDDARAGHEKEDAPVVLRRAQELFGRFSQDGWRIDVTDAGEIRALDVRLGELRSLQELSDGTRVQLLLASRLAGIEQVEQSAGPLPLCLDEALATTDGVRFRVVVEALFELANAGRQILYLTADHGEVAQWRAACEALERPAPAVIDLAAAGPAALRVDANSLPALPAPDPVPSPLHDEDAASYGRRLGVAAPDGHRPASDWHLIYLVPDDLSALRRCLQRRIDRLGVWRAACRAGHVPSTLSPDVRVQIDTRGDMLELALDAWRVGRGRPVTWEDVEASGAVSVTFVERVREVLNNRADDPRAFVEGVRALSRFRTNSADDLENHLFAAGILDDRPRLAPGEIVPRALSALAPDADDASTEAAAAYVEWLIQLLPE